MTTIGDVALVIIDPVSAYLGRTDSHNNSEVRAVLSPLSRLAEKHNAAVVCVTHLNKGTGSNAVYRTTGSLAFGAAARMVLVIGKDPNNETGQRRLLVQQSRTLHL